MLPAQALSGSGVFGGEPVRCDAPQWAVRWHTGYPSRAVDHHDVPLLCHRFGLAVPEAFARRQDAPDDDSDTAAPTEG